MNKCTYTIEAGTNETKAVTKVRADGKHLIHPGIINADPVANAIMQANQRNFGAMLHRIAELCERFEENPEQFKEAISDFESKYGKVEQ